MSTLATLPPAESSRRLQIAPVRVAGAVLLLVGAVVLIWSLGWHHERSVALGVMVAGLGAALVMMRNPEGVAIPVAAVIVSLVPFGLFILCAGANPFRACDLMYTGAFGTWFSFQNTLTRAAPLMLTGLCTALPAQVGLVIIGGEGALVVGGLAAAGMAHLCGAAPWEVTIPAMLIAGFAAGAFWIGLAGALRHFRGVNETISSLLLVYIAAALLNHLCEGPWRDPTSLNKPSTWYIGDANMMGSIPGMDVHWGLIFGLVACVLAYLLVYHTIHGFASRVAGGNVRAARIAGLSVGTLVLLMCALGGGAAGLAGAIEISAVQGAANSSLMMAGYGYTGILVAFLARQNPLGVIPVAILIGGIGASGGLLARRLDLPDATVLVLQGMLFVTILMSEAYYGRIRLLQPKGAAHA